KTDGRAPVFYDAMSLLFGTPNQDRRLFLSFWTEGPSWGMGELTGDDRPGSRSENFDGNRFAIVLGAPSAFVASHELGHLLGAVSGSAPNASPYGHCTSLFDVMCYADGDRVRMNRVCPMTEYNRLDCGNDDYFATTPGGSYLGTHWNVADSPFLTSAVVPETCLDVAQEPDDWRRIYLNMVSGRRVFAAPVLPVGVVQTRAFCGEYDWSDRSRIDVKAGQRYRVEVGGLSGVTSTLIRVWDPVTRRYLASNAGASDPFAFGFTARADGPLGLEVLNRRPTLGSGTPYTIRVTAVTSGTVPG
ncbi:MAG: hypothetical protein ACR2J8_11615, partial [Thermomicrobiales bacterium]